MAFLWSGPELNARKTTIAWPEVYRPKSEGGLGVQLLKETNQVSFLKLILRIVSAQPSLSVQWVKSVLVGKESFWLIKESTMKGSWMWRKILKYREVAKQYHNIEVCNDKATSFWFDNWSPLGRLYNLTGHRRVVDICISTYATITDVFENHRRRGPRVEYLNAMEDAIDKVKSERKDGDDSLYWKYSDNVCKQMFVTRNTWRLIRTSHPTTSWHKVVWFTHVTPKYYFLTWLAIQNRLTTGDRIRGWGSSQIVECCLCRNPDETRNHIFFNCCFSGEIWKNTLLKLLGTEYTTN